MLTGDLVRARVRGGELEPSLVPVACHLERAADLLELVDGAVAQRWRRRELDEALTELIGDARDHRIVKGMAKVLLDKCEVEVDAALPPKELRRRVFEAARAAGPLALEPGPLGRPVARDVLRQVGEALGVSWEQVSEALYADLKEEQRLISRGGPANPEALVSRYNVALVQALLLRASQVRVELVDPSARRVRQLFRHVRFHQLVHEVHRRGDRLHLVLDGPTSLFRQSTRYGMQLASFFPALLLQEVPWTLEATVIWTRARHRKRLHLTHDQGLVSHYRDTGAWKTKEAQWLEERFAALDTDWELSERVQPLDLGGKAMVLPDYRLRKEGRVAWVEIVGFWQRDWLERRLDLLRRYGPGNLILAISRKLLTDKADKSDLPGEIIEFSKIVPARRVLEAAERVAR